MNPLRWCLVGDDDPAASKQAKLITKTGTSDRNIAQSGWRNNDYFDVYCGQNNKFVTLLDRHSLYIEWWIDNHSCPKGLANSAATASLGCNWPFKMSTTVATMGMLAPTCRARQATAAALSTPSATWPNEAVACNTV